MVQVCTGCGVVEGKRYCETNGVGSPYFCGENSCVNTFPRKPLTYIDWTDALVLLGIDINEYEWDLVTGKHIDPEKINA